MAKVRDLDGMEWAVRRRWWRTRGTGYLGACGLDEPAARDVTLALIGALAPQYRGIELAVVSPTPGTGRVSLSE